MTSLSRSVVLGGILLFVTGTILWIVQGNWQWFAGGAAIFVGAILAGAILSVEVKHPQREERSYSPTPSTPTEEPPPPPPQTVKSDDPFAT